MEPAIVTLRVWGVPARAVPRAMSRMMFDRRAVRTTAGLQFAKLLGTGAGTTFTPLDADPRHWALLCCWADRDAAASFEHSTISVRWRHICDEELAVTMRPLTSRGRWSGCEPFGSPQRTAPPGAMVAALTRARLRPRRAAAFWRAVPPVTEQLHRSDGLVLAFGLGEAPIGFQGTFSLWRDARALTSFAYGGQAHRAAIEATARVGWYAEELFARFAVESVTGRLRGIPATEGSRSAAADGSAG